MKMKLLLAVASVLALATAPAHAALDAAVVSGIQTEVLGDIDTAVAAGFAIMAVVLGASVGMSLLGRFISKGANGG